MSFVQSNPLLASLAISFGVNIFFFIFAASFRTDKVTDISYSLSFFLLTLFLLFFHRSPRTWEQLLAAGAVLIWSVRLGGYLLYRIIRIGKDDRFDDKRGNLIKFLKFWILQASAVWVIMLPVTVFLTSEPEGVYPYITLPGGVVFLAGLIIEAVSDMQKFRYRNNPANKGHWADQGLWRYSRHPNYFGEILVWWGIFLTAVPHLRTAQWLTIAGPVSITLLLLYVTGIPLLEKSADGKYGSDPAYIRYRDSTNLLIPGPVKEKS